jgi:serine/threonine-protein phosphatase 6 regulatory subunit 3
MHTVVSELIKGIISMAAPSPGAGLTEGLQNGPASNRFARELAHRDSISALTGYILYDFEADQPLVKPSGGDSADNVAPLPSELPNGHSAMSSVIHSISVIIELIRKNNSDYFEPYLFHTLRNRLIQVQQQLQGADNARETLEAAMKEMVDRMGVVNLGPLLDIMCERLSHFQQFLLQPRSLVCSSCGSPTMTGSRLSPAARARADYCGSHSASYVRAVSNLRIIRRTSPLFEYVSAEPLLGARSPLR